MAEEKTSMIFTKFFILTGFSLISISVLLFIIAIFITIHSLRYDFYLDMTLSKNKLKLHEFRDNRDSLKEISFSNHIRLDLYDCGNRDRKPLLRIFGLNQHPKKADGLLSTDIQYLISDFFETKSTFESCLFDTVILNQEDSLSGIVIFFSKILVNICNSYPFLYRLNGDLYNYLQLMMKLQQFVKKIVIDDNLIIGIEVGKVGEDILIFLEQGLKYEKIESHKFKFTDKVIPRSLILHILHNWCNQKSNDKKSVIIRRPWWKK